MILSRLARLLHCTEGRTYTLVLGVALAVTVTAFTVPAVLNHRPPPPVKAIPFQDLSTGAGAAPLTIEEGGFSSASPGQARIPGRDLPVAVAGGVITEAAFVRLSGQARLLTLQVDAAASQNAEAARLLMCPIQVETWQPIRDLPMSAAPIYDCGSAVSGVRSPDGGWTFDLGRFTDRAGSRGFAIVPAPSGAATYEVALVANP